MILEQRCAHWVMRCVKRLDHPELPARAIATVSFDQGDAAKPVLDDITEDLGYHGDAGLGMQGDRGGEFHMMCRQAEGHGWHY